MTKHLVAGVLLVVAAAGCSSRPRVSVSGISVAGVAGVGGLPAVSVGASWTRTGGLALSAGPAGGAPGALGPSFEVWMRACRACGQVFAAREPGAQVCGEWCETEGCRRESTRADDSRPEPISKGR